MCSTTATTMTPPQTATNSTAPATLSQGIKGTISQLSGNQMPSNSPNPSATEEPVSTTVWVFSDRIPGPGSPYWPIAEAKQHPNLVCTTQSDAAGHYQIQLPPSEYTVLAQYDESLYLNSFQGDGSYRSITVAPEQIIEFDLTHIEQAFF
ncbi:hypothetical protein [Synechococcus sp. PCC 7335]|uniref:hypothetical protein n=1 Tax=Synechococcus sp. (strain ATCC 29403 / PCC 7335) TaxID=91464 RepID=UPI001D0CF004|nr:hypothetical protein [Synechococcus sp. PCC 7335]